MNDAAAAAPAGDGEDVVGRRPCGRDGGARFSHAISLGSLCATAAWLQGQGLRMGAGPFDWVHSSPAMVRHCLRDDFAEYTDRSQYVVTGQHVGHKLYSTMLFGTRREGVWLHHDPLHKDEDYDLLLRSVSRLRQALLKSNGRKLLVLCILVASRRALQSVRGPEGDNDDEASDDGVDGVAGGTGLTDEYAGSRGMETSRRRASFALGCRDEVRGLFHDLYGMGVRLFHLDVIYLCTGSASSSRGGEAPCAALCETAVVKGGVIGMSGRVRDGGSDLVAANKGSSDFEALGGETLAIHELHLIGDHTGLRFKKSADEDAFTALLLKRGADGGDLLRRFALEPFDALPASLGPRSVSKYGDDLFLGSAPERLKDTASRNRASYADLRAHFQRRSPSALQATHTERPTPAGLIAGAPCDKQSGAQHSSTSARMSFGDVRRRWRRKSAVPPRRGHEATFSTTPSARAKGLQAGSAPASSDVPAQQMRASQRPCRKAGSRESATLAQPTKRRKPGPPSSSSSSLSRARLGLTARSAMAATDLAAPPTSSTTTASTPAPAAITSNTAAQRRPMSGLAAASDEASAEGPKDEALASPCDMDVQQAVAASLLELEASSSRERVEAEASVARVVLEELLSMGFEREAASAALSDAGGDQMRALDALLSAA
mmetsp:Transcript_17502/g.47948  ORF Transcript_17502/g.47948 Transcript_17502/m.47948 type:complete len:662 (+) Transcript_17502:70-2055(+)